MPMLIIAKGKGEYDKGKKEPKADEPSPDTGKMAAKSAAKDVLAAIKDGDAGKLSAALKAHYAACEE